MTKRLEAEAGLRHLEMANARLRRRETREWAMEQPEFREALRGWIQALKMTLEWMES